MATEADETIATRFLDRVAKTIEVVRQSPLMGPTREPLGSGLRVTFHHPYAIYYHVTDRELIIVRVLHGARDTAAIAEQGGFLH
jgi:toxin ParE1/3/4